MKKHIMAFTMMVAAYSLSYAQGNVDYPWLTFRLTDNSEVSVPSENLQLTYSNGELHLTSSTVDQTFLLSSLKSMRFETVQAGIEDVEADAKTLIEVFSPNGVKVAVSNSIGEAVTGLPHGVYIIQVGKSSKKVMF